MQERTKLDHAIAGLKAMEGELAECLELIEMGEAEGDGDIVADADDLDFGEGAVRALFFGRDIDVLDELVAVAAIRRYPQAGVDH